MMGWDVVGEVSGGSALVGAEVAVGPGAACDVDEDDILMVGGAGGLFG